MRHLLVWGAILSMLAFVLTGTREFSWAAACFLLAHQLGREKG